MKPGELVIDREAISRESTQRTQALSFGVGIASTIRILPATAVKISGTEGIHLFLFESYLCIICAPSPEILSPKIYVHLAPY